MRVTEEQRADRDAAGTGDPDGAEGARLRAQQAGVRSSDRGGAGGAVGYVIAFPGQDTSLIENLDGSRIITEHHRKGDPGAVPPSIAPADWPEVDREIIA